MKTIASWNVELCSQIGTNVSEEHAAYIFGITEVQSTVFSPNSGAYLKNLNGAVS
jgi:hypothetical protein